MILSTYLQDGIGGAEWHEGTPPPDSARDLIVAKVAAVSLAAAAGVRSGDRLIDIDKQPAARFNFEQLVDAQTYHVYRFFRPGEGRWLKLKTRGAPLGVKLWKSVELIVDHAVKGRGDWSDLDELWERGEWAALEKAASISLKPGLLLSLIAFFLRISFRGTPALLMRGAALYELGKEQQGLALIREYHEKYEEGWTTQFHAIARYYLGLAALKEGHRDKALAYLEEAFAYLPLDRIAEPIEQLTARQPTKKADLVGTPFPFPYVLTNEKTGRSVALDQCLRKVLPHQIKVLCLLSSYRTNGPYDSFMKRYTRLASHFADFLAELHVITEVTRAEAEQQDTREFVDRWLAAEEQAARRQVPFQVLLDSAGEVAAAVNAEGSPHLVVLNAKGTILKTGDFDDVEFWDLLARAEEVS